MLAKLVIVGGDDDGNGNDVEAYKAPKTVLGTSSTALETSGGCRWMSWGTDWRSGVRTERRADGRKGERAHVWTDGRAFTNKTFVLATIGQRLAHHRSCRVCSWRNLLLTRKHSNKSLYQEIWNVCGALSTHAGAEEFPYEHALTPILAFSFIFA